MSRNHAIVIDKPHRDHSESGNCLVLESICGVHGPVRGPKWLQREIL